MEIPEQILAIIKPGEIPEDFKQIIIIEAAKVLLEAAGTLVSTLPLDYFEEAGAFNTSNIKEQIKAEVTKLSDKVSEIANETIAMVNPGSTIGSINGVMTALGVVLPLINSLGITGPPLDLIKTILTAAGAAMTVALVAYTALGAVPIVGPVSYPPDPVLMAKVPIIVEFLASL